MSTIEGQTPMSTQPAKESLSSIPSKPAVPVEKLIPPEEKQKPDDKSLDTAKSKKVESGAAVFQGEASPEVFERNMFNATQTLRQELDALALEKYKKSSYGELSIGAKLTILSTLEDIPASTREVIAELQRILVSPPEHGQLDQIKKALVKLPQEKDFSGLDAEIQRKVVEGLMSHVSVYRDNYKLDQAGLSRFAGEIGDVSVGQLSEESVNYSKDKMIRNRRRTEISLGDDEEIDVAVLGFGEFKKHFINLYNVYGYPSAGEQESQKRIQMLLTHVKEDGSDFDTDFMAIQYLKKTNRIEDVDQLKKILRTKKILDNGNIAIFIDEKNQIIDKNLFTDDDAKALDALKQEIQEKTDAYLNVKFTGAALEAGHKPESAVMSATDKSWNTVLVSENGVVELVYNLYDSKLNTAMSTNTTTTHRITNLDMERMEQDIVEEILSNTYYRKLLGHPIDEKEAKYYMHIAKNLATITFKPTVACVKSSASSGELKNGVNAIARRSYDTNPAALTDSPYESYSAAFDLIAFVEKWDNLSPGAKIMLYRVGEFVSKRLGLSGEVKNEALRLLHSARGNGLDSEEAQLIIANKLKKVWGEPLDKKTGSSGTQIDKFDGRYAIWEKFQQNKIDVQKQLEFVLMAEKGFPVVSELLEAYDPDSSGWRIMEKLNQLSKIYKDSDNMALGYRIQSKGGEWLRNSSKTKVQNEIDAAFQDLKKELEKTAKYRPQTNALWLYQQKDEAFLKWWHSDGAQLEAKSFLSELKGETWLQERLNWISFEGKVGFAAVNDVVMDKFICINAELERKGLQPINFFDSDSLNTSQREIALSVFNENSESLDMYCSFMKKLSNQVSNEVDIFKKAEYRRYFKRTQFVDDARLRQIEDPQSLLELAEKDSAGNMDWPKELEPLLNDPKQIKDLILGSKLTSPQGASRRASLARFIGDFMTMKEMPSIIVKGLGSDDKKFIEMIQEIKQHESTYAGKDAALTACLYFTAGYLKTAETDNSILKFLNIGKEFARTSEQKRLYGNKGQSFGDIEMNEFLNNIDLIFSKAENYSENIAELVFDLEEEIGLAKRGFDGKRIWREDWRSPYWMKRFLMLALVLGAFFSTTFAKKIIEEAEEGFGEKKRK